MIPVIFLLFISVESKKGGFFFAEPKFVTNYPNDYSDTVESYFYLQQTSKWTVRFNLGLHVKKQFGPMMGNIELLALAGGTFRKQSGGLLNDLDQNVCADRGAVDIFRTFEPQTGFNEEECFFLPGNYTSSIDYDKHLHAATDKFSYGATRVVFLIVNPQEKKTYFGFMIQIDFYDLDLHKFIAKD